MQYSYDSTGVYFYYFVASVLGLVLTPSTYSWVKETFFTATPPSQSRKRLIKYRSNRKRVWRILKFVGLVAGWISLLYLANAIRNTELPEQPELFDPWKILDISTSATPSEIRKRYRELSLQWHPDKVSEEQKEEAAAKFEMFTKAKNVLTNDEARKNWEEFGHPDGRQSMSMGIALPTWLVSSTASPFVLSIYFGIFGLLLPYTIGKWWYRSRLYTKDNILSKTMSLFFKGVQEESNMKQILTVLSMADEWDREIGLNGEAGEFKKEVKAANMTDEFIKNLEKQVKKEYDNRSGEKFDLPAKLTNRTQRLAYLLLQSYLLRIPLSNESQELIRDLVVEKSFHVIQTGLLQITLARGWLVPSLLSMDLCQIMAQAAPHSSSPFLQLPHFDSTIIDKLKSVVITFQTPDSKVSESKGIKAIQELAEIPEKDRKKLLKEVGLGSRIGFEKAYADVMKACNEYPRLVLEKVDFRVAGEETITPSAFVTCTLRVRLVPVTVPVDQLSAEYDKRKKELEQKKAEKAKSKSNGKQIEDDEDEEDLDGLNFETEGDGGDGRIFKKKRVQPKVVEAKYYPGEKRPYWWIFIGNLMTNRIINAVKVTDLVERKTIKLQFQAPPQPGVYPFSVFLKSETFIGTDMRLDIQMKVEQPSKIQEVAEDDDISEPEEDSLAGQMAMLRNARSGGAAAGGANGAAGGDDTSSSEDESEEEESDDE